MQAVELDRSPQRGPAHHGLEDAGAVHVSGQRAAMAEAPRRPDRRDRRAPFLQPPHLGMADEPLGMGPGEHDGMDVGVAVGAVHQLLELVGDVEAEQAVRAAVDPGDQDGSAVLDLEVAFVLVCHEIASVGTSAGVGRP